MAMGALSPVPTAVGSGRISSARNSFLSPSTSDTTRLCTGTASLFFSKNAGCRLTGSPRRKNRSWRHVNCTYSGVGSDFSSAPIDVVAEIRTEKIVILGGNGFVGSAIAREAVRRNIEVVSLSRSGRPPLPKPWMDQVTWIAGDVFDTDWASVLHGATAVISTLGGFGTNEQMEKLNGDANIEAVNATSNEGIKKFILISVHDYNLPDFALQTGYFTGKRRAEEEVLVKFPNSGTIFRPGPIYGRRIVNGFEVPLDLIGQPIENLLAQARAFTTPFSKLPASDLILVPPINVKDLAAATMLAVKDDTVFGIFNIEQIKEMAAALSPV